MYKHPFGENVERRPAQPTGDFAHANFLESKYAVDFLIPVDTYILTARAGTVWKIKDDSNEYGLGLEFASKANFVAVDHGDGTFAEYIHFKCGGVVVEEGQKVSVGDILGYSGLSGCMDVPHLHFNVFKIENNKGISVPFEFID